MWSTTCNICGEHTSGTPDRCLRCGADMKMHGSSTHYQVERQFDMAGPNKATLNSRLEEAKTPEDRAAAFLISFCESYADSKYVTSITDGKIACRSDSHQRFYFVVYYDLPIRYICSKNADYEAVSGQRLLDELAASPVVDGILFNPPHIFSISDKYDHSAFIKREDILNRLHVTGVKQIDKYSKDGLNEEFYVYNVAKDIFKKMDAELIADIKAHPDPEHYYDNLSDIIRNDYLKDLTIDNVDYELMTYQIIDKVLEKIFEI